MAGDSLPSVLPPMRGRLRGARWGGPGKRSFQHKPPCLCRKSLGAFPAQVRARKRCQLGRHSGDCHSWQGLPRSVGRGGTSQGDEWEACQPMLWSLSTCKLKMRG